MDADVSNVTVLDRHSGTTGRAHLALTGDPTLPATVWAKLAPFDAAQRKFVNVQGMGVAEARLYRDLAHELPVRVPQVWFADFEGDGTGAGDRTGFLDWAVIARAPGIRDIAYVLSASTPTELRRAHEDALLQRYRDVLAAHGIALDGETAWEQYRLFTIYGWCAATCTAAMGSRWQPEHIGLGGTERSTIAAVDLDCVGLLAEKLA